MGSDSWPRLTIVTPSYNQAEFLERTIDSVLSQGYPRLEYIVVDGGSSDGSVEVIRRYEKHIAWWTSEKDRGQVHAINKGLERATGEWVGWQNSDDVYMPGAFRALADAIRSNPAAGVVLGCLLLIDARDRALREVRYVRPTWRSLRAEGCVMANQACFWRRDLQAKLGLLNEAYDCSFDYDWFLRLLRETSAAYVDRPLGALRLHGATKTSNLGAKFTAQNAAILAEHGRPGPLEKLLYQSRRAIGIAANGHVGYVLRGIGRRGHVEA